ncbi:hypothetical protein ODZ58_04580, partial [Escherichia coli]|nr:hypothetical protein [Escherichia coli]
FGFAENTDDLFVGKTLLHGDVLMWLMKTLLTSGCTNQRGAGHDDYGQRRLVHSFRHTMISTCLAGWVGNLAHLQQVVGHEKSGSGITRRYLHTFPLSTICYVIDGLGWE